MMVITAKVKKRNIAIIIAAIAAILLFLLLPGKSESKTTGTNAGIKAETNEQRIAFLESFGWTAEASPIETQEVRIPDEENEIFARYNELQKSQGYDLSEYAGKNVKRYVYHITNHPDADGNYQATILVYKGKIIGGDVASTDAGGKMHSFNTPS